MRLRNEGLLHTLVGVSLLKTNTFVRLRYRPNSSLLKQGTDGAPHKAKRLALSKVESIFPRD